LGFFRQLGGDFIDRNTSGFTFLAVTAEPHRPRFDIFVAHDA
jgi:hypothetical protein